jgi:hypothetical protein
MTTDWMTGGQFLAEAKDFSSSLCVQTSSEAQPAYPIGTGGPFPGVKHGQDVMVTTCPHLVLRSRMNKSYTPFPLVTCMVVVGHFFTGYSYIPIFISVSPVKVIILICCYFSSLVEISFFNTFVIYQIALLNSYYPKHYQTGQFQNHVIPVVFFHVFIVGIPTL